MFMDLVFIYRGLENCFLFYQSINYNSLKNTKPIPLGDSDTITVGEDIVSIENPAGLEGTVSKGIISGVRKAEEIG